MRSNGGPEFLRARYEQRFGAGRAVAAASNGVQTVVAATVDIAVGSEPGGAFRSIAPSDGSVSDVAISPDGDRVALVTVDRTFQLWAIAEQPTAIATLSDVTGAGFRVDGAVVVFGSDVIRVLDADDGSSLDEWEVPFDRSLGPAAVLDDGSVLVALAGGPSPEIVIWNGPPDGRTVVVDGEGDSRIARVVAAGDRFAVGVLDDAGVLDGRIATFAGGNDEPLWSIDVGAVAGDDAWSFGADGSVVIGDDSTVRLVDETSTIAVESPVAEVSVDGVIVFADGAIGRVSESGAIEEIAGEGERVVDLHVDRTSDVVTFVDALGRIATPSGGATALIESDDFVSAPLNDVAVALVGRFATAATNGVVEVRDGGGSEVTRLLHDEGNVDSVAFAAGGTQIATGVAQRRAATAFDDTVSLWSTDEGARLFEIGGEAEDVAGCSFFTNRLRFAANGTFVVSTSHDFTVSVIGVPGGELLHTFPPHANTVLDVAISPDGLTLVASGDGSTMRVWDLTSYELIADHLTTMGRYWSLSFLPDGASVVAGDLSGNLSVVDVVTGAIITTFQGSKLRQARSAVSPDGRFVAAGSDDSIVRLWSTVTGEVVGEAAGHDGPVRRLRSSRTRSGSSVPLATARQSSGACRPDRTQSVRGLKG